MDSTGDDIEQQAGGAEPTVARRRFTRPMMVLTLVVAGLLCVTVVGAVGWYQFAHRAKKPIETIRYHAIPGTDVNIGDGIYSFLESKGIKAATEGFKPSWGAEELADGVWMVSYVYEVGREAQWISWKVYTRTGRVVPQCDLARELW